MCVKKEKSAASVLYLLLVLALIQIGGSIAFSGQKDNQATDVAASEISSPSNCTGRDILVKGRVVREVHRHSYQARVTFGPDSVGRISIRPIGPMDAPMLPVFSAVEFSPVPQLPFEFCLGGTLSEIPSGPYAEGANYQIGIELRQQTGRSLPGDMLGEYAHIIELPMQNDRLVVTGLESCDAEKRPGFSPGGYCVQEAR